MPNHIGFWDNLQKLIPDIYGHVILVVLVRVVGAVFSLPHLGSGSAPTVLTAVTKACLSSQAELRKALADQDKMRFN